MYLLVDIYLCENVYNLVNLYKYKLMCIIGLDPIIFISYYSN